MKDDIEIDPEIWLQYLIAVLPNDEKREKVIQKVSEASGVSPDKVEEIMQAMVKLFLKTTRQN